MADNEAAARCGPAPGPAPRHGGNDRALLLLGRQRWSIAAVAVAGEGPAGGAADGAGGTAAAWPGRGLGAGGVGRAAREPESLKIQVSKGCLITSEVIA
jgi:hypothetical protein